jgi:hypothetical protein
MPSASIQNAYYKNQKRFERSLNWLSLDEREKMYSVRKKPSAV